MNVYPLVACGPSGQGLLVILAVAGGGTLLLLASFVAGLVLLCKRQRTAGLWLMFAPLLVVAAITGWVRSQ